MRVDLFHVSDIYLKFFEKHYGDLCCNRLFEEIPTFDHNRPLKLFLFRLWEVLKKNSPVNSFCPVNGSGNGKTLAKPPVSGAFLS